MEVRSNLLLHTNQQKKRPRQQSFDPTAPKRRCWVQCTHGAVRVAGSQASQQQPEGYGMQRCNIPGCVAEAESWYSTHGSQLRSAGLASHITDADAPPGASDATPLPSTCSHCNSQELLCDLRLCSECCFNTSCTCSAASHVQPPTTTNGCSAPAITAQSARAAATVERPKADIEVLLLPLSAKKGTVFLSNQGLPVSKSCVHTSTGNNTQLAQSMSGGQRIYFVGRCQYGTGNHLFIPWKSHFPTVSWKWFILSCWTDRRQPY